MSDSRTLALLRQVRLLYLIGAVIFLFILTAIYFWFGSQDFSASEHMTRRLLQSFVMAVVTNMVPVFLFFVGSYFLLRRVQQIQSEHDREALTVAIAAAVRADLSESIRASGVHEVFRRFYTDVQWNELLRGTTEFDLIVSYARTWKNTHREQLKQIATNPRACIRVVLANPKIKRLLQSFLVDMDCRPKRSNRMFKSPLRTSGSYLGQAPQSVTSVFPIDLAFSPTIASTTCSY